MFKIVVIDGQEVPNPEDVAMLQALYSRSAASVTEHLEKVRKSGSARFLDNYVVGYGHKSIADCGTTTVFIEGVSTLAAKALQDWPLYSGQETSTRYIDMSKQHIVDPVGTERSGEILARWMNFYKSNQDRVMDTIRKRYPRRPEDFAELATQKEKEVAYERAVKARSFDILRGFLPAGITTQLSWHTNLRQAGDHLILLSKHPSDEIRQVGLSLQRAFAERYPSSGAGLGLASVSAVRGGAEERLEWEQVVADKYTYSASTAKESFHSTIFPKDLEPYMVILKARPKGCVLPHFMTDLGQLSFSFLLDFGSFRDIQRHRNGVCRMPLLTTEYGFEPWYLDQLDPELKQEAEKLVAFLSGAIGTFTDDHLARQYYIPMGFRVQNQVTYGLPAAVYVMELRSNKTVHPTLRRVIHGMVAKFRDKFPDVTIHADMDPDDWSLRRGSQTIVALK
jgi:thymidylate synthase ThyX